MNKNTWSCQFVCECLNDYVCDRLSDVEHLAVTQHLNGCTFCQDTLILERRLIDAPKVQIVAPTNFSTSVLAVYKRQQTHEVLNRLCVFYFEKCTHILRSIFADPLLRVVYKIPRLLSPVWWALGASLSVITSRVFTEVTKVYQHIWHPIKQAIAFGND